MSQFTDFGENKLVDRFRGQADPYGANLYAGLASAATDGSITELTGTGYARVALLRALATWAGTQGPGTTLASSGTSHATSNNGDIDFGTAGSAWGTATHLPLYTASSGGNPIAYFPLSTPLVIANGDPVVFAAGSISFTVGLSGGCCDVLANMIIDEIWRGQAGTFPDPLWHGLFTAAPSNAGGGTEVSGTGYGRVAVPGTLAGLAGTQSAGSTTASSGSSGMTSNNAAITYAGPVTGSWGTVTHMGYFDAETGGNLLMWAALASSRTLAAGATPPSFAAGAQTIRVA